MLRMNDSPSQSAQGCHMPFPSQADLRHELAARSYPDPNSAERSAAVLICLYQEEILLVRRCASSHDKWSGHIGLPGGKYDVDNDSNLLETALRETYEELGFHAADEGQILGALGTYFACYQEPRDLAIGVFVTELSARPKVLLSDEIESEYWVALSALECTEAYVPEKSIPVPAYRLTICDDELVVWGITYGILERLRMLA